MAVSYNKMSSIQIGGTYVNYVSIGARGNVSLDCSGNSLFRGATFMDASLNVSGIFNVGGDVSMNSNLFVGGDVSMNSKLFVGGDVSMNSKLQVGGDVSMNSKLFVGGDVSMNFKLFVGGDVSMNSKLFVGGDVSMNSKLFVGGDVSMNSKLFVGGDVSMNSKLQVGGDVFIDGSLNVLNINSSNTTSDFNFATNQTTGKTLISTGNGQTGNIQIGTGTGIKNLNLGGTATTINLVGSLITCDTVLPSSNLTPTLGKDLTTKTYVDSVAGGSTLLSSNNTWTGTNAFNTSLPTSTVTPTTSTQLTTKAYVDSVGGVSLSGNNTWTGTNAFNTSLPTSTVTPSSGTDLTTKTYVDSVAGSSLLSSNNTWTGTNAFNTSLPTSTVTPTTSTQLTTKTYVDSNFCNLSGTQTITGDKTFNGSIDFLSFSVSAIDNTGSISTPSVESGLQTDDLLVGQNQTSGKLFLGCRTDRTGNINIGTLATGNAPINIGSTSSTTQTATHNAITTFSKIPSCSVAPTTSNHLTNKTYVDSNFCSLTGTQTVSGEKTFSNANTYVGGNLVSNNIKSTSGSLNISTNPGSVVDTLNISTGADMFLDCGDLGKIYLSQDGGTCFSIDGASANFNTEVNFFADTISDGLSVHNMMPTATIIQNVSSTVPDGFFYCDGQAVSRSTFSNLFDKIGTTFGVGNGSTTFNVPNFKGAFLRGAGSQTVSGTTHTAASVGTAQSDDVLEHIHTYSDLYWYDDTSLPAGSTRSLTGANYEVPGGDTTGVNADGGQTKVMTSAAVYAANATQANAATTPSPAIGAETRPMNYAVYYYIRY